MTGLFVDPKQTSLSHIQVIKMLIFIVTIFLVCWGPRLIMNVMIKLGLSSFTNEAYTARIACYLLSFIHSALNPFLYGFMWSNFRRMMIHTCPNNNSDSRSGCMALSHFNNRRHHRSASDCYEPSATMTNCATITGTDVTTEGELSKRSSSSDSMERDHFAIRLSGMPRTFVLGGF